MLLLGTRQGRALIGAILLLGLGVALGQGAAERPAVVPDGKRAVEPVAPEVPAEVVAALQEGRYADAIKALDAMAADPQGKADSQGYAALLGGVARQLAGRLDEARDVLSKAIAAAPAGPWAAKLRAQLASVELAAGRFPQAEALARAQAEALLADARKDRLAGVYQAYARKLLEPNSPVAQADPEGAHALLEQARNLAKGDALRSELLLAMARSSQRAGNHGRAAGEFQAYLNEYPKGADRATARFGLGEAQIDSAQHVAARQTWSDLARDLAKADDGRSADLRARALYGIARTYGTPNPPDDNSMNLGVAALRRLVEAYPGHRLAVTASYQIGAAYLARGKSQEALEALRAFIAQDGRGEGDEARRQRSELVMTARFQVGQVLQGQGKFGDAIDAWKDYLAKYPDGPQSADAQRAILDTQLLIAQDHLARERYDAAREVWRAFAAEHPLDARVPQVLFSIGDSFRVQEKDDDAIAAWETLIGKFPGTEPAAHAQFQIALIHEERKGDPAAAIERYAKVTVEPWASQARQRTAVMESKTLAVVTPRAFRSGEVPVLKIATRNLESLRFTAYRLNPEAYFRKKHALGGVESLDIGLVAPDAEWTAPVQGYAKYKPVEAEYPLKKVEVPGVFVVKVTDEKTLQATTLVLGSDLDAIVKSSRDQLLVFAQDMKTGKGREGARVLVASGEVVLDAVTGKDGVLLHNWDKPRDPGSALEYLILDGANAAGSDLSIPPTVAQGLSPRAYLYTDRPAYRPGQGVELRGVVREVRDGQYSNAPKAEYKLEVTDSRGRPFLARTVALSEFGTFHESIPLDSGAPVGTYRVRLFQPGKSEFAGQFEVQAYQLEKVDLTFDLPRSVYFRGETIAGKVIARYQYGTPLARRPIVVVLPDGRRLEGQTDAAGAFAFEQETAGFAEEQALRIIAQLPEENVAAAAAVSLAVRAFSIELDAPRDVYLDGESFRLRVRTRDAAGEPTGEALSVSVLKVVARAGQASEREVQKKPLATDPKTGEATLPLTIDDEDGGRYILRASGTDRFKNAVVAELGLMISGRKDETRLRILADRTSFKVGEEASVRLHSREPAGPALLTWEADRVLRYQIVELKEGETPLAWAVEGPQFPNFTLTAARMVGTRFDEARLDVEVKRDLKVSVKPARESVGPGEAVEVEVATTDQLGRPVPAEVSLALVDEALLRLFRDSQPPIGPFFYDQTRTGAFATESTNTFRYEPASVPVPEAVVEAQEQELAQAADALRLGEIRDEAKSEVTLNMPAPAAAAAPAPVPAERGALGMTKSLAGEMADGRAGREVLARRKMGGMSGGMGGAGFGMIAEGLDRTARADEDFDAAGKNLAFFGRFAGDKDGKAPSPARQSFVETAYWNPAIVTGPDGTAKVTLKAPTALSRYRFTARGVTGADTLVGQDTAALAVRKDFFVELKTPAVLAEGDRPRFSARLHHAGAKGEVQVRLALYAGGREAVFPKTLTLDADGVEDLLFDPFEVPDGDVVRLELSATLGDASDRLVAEVPIRPWGVQAFASASGTSSDDATAFVELPAGRPYVEPEMLVVLSPTLPRMLIELALGREAYPVEDRGFVRCFPPPPDTLADRASDLLAACSALNYLRATGGASAPEAERLSDRIRGLVGELVTRQNDDGGWPWVGGNSNRAASARATWAIAAAEPLGLVPNAQALDKATTYLTQEFAKVDAADQESRAAILHALATRRKASFEQANALNRERQNLSDVALAYLALTFAELERTALAGEVLDVLAPRAKTEPAGPGLPPRRYWEGRSNHPFHRGPAEATALAALAFARARPAADELRGAADWLLAHRNGDGWQPHKAKGPALAALAVYYGKAKPADDRYHLTVTVNDEKVHDADVAGRAEGQAIRVPVKAVKAGGRNRVHFDIEGRGTFGYAVTLTGFTREFKPDQDPANKTFGIHRRVYWAPTPTLDGKPLPAGFSSAVNPKPFENTITQIPVGGRFTVSIESYRNQPVGEPDWTREFLVLEEHLPAGTTLVEGSLNTPAAHHTLADGVLTLYFAPDQWPSVTYEVYGYLPGDYRALPPKVRSAYEPGRLHLGKPAELKVLPPGEKSTDPYKPTPDELYHRGKGLFDAGRLAEAAAPLEALWSAYTLRDEIAKDAARMLLVIHIKDNQPRKVVQYFEILKEKAPELVIPFDQIKVIGRAYAEIGEHERAYLVWRATAEASYLDDARVGEVLRQRGEALASTAFLLDLWREYPSTASIDADFYGLSQRLASLAGRATTDPALRHELALAKVGRPDLLLQEVRLLQVFLSLAPKNPLADEASLALVNAFLDLEDFEAVVKLARRYAALYPKSTYFDSYQYAEALGRFHLGEYDRAVEVAEAIARATYKDANGVDQPSPNRWQALYILGQIFDARRRPARAVEFYQQVADRFTDAADAVRDLTRQSLTLPEVTTIRPAATPRVAAGEGFRAVPPAAAETPAAGKPQVELKYRNIAEADVKVYPVDLMRLYLTRRSLDGIAGIDLAGITPLYETKVKLGDGKDFEDRTRVIELPLEKEGAYLVMIRGDNLYASGIALVSPLEMEVQEEAVAGRVRVRVLDARTRDYANDVQVKVIGTANPQFLGGETDLRGVYVAEGVRGQVTAVARRGERQYAFYRGTTTVGSPPAEPNAPADQPAKAGAAGKPQSLEDNLRQQSNENQIRNLKRLEERYNAAPSQGVKVEGVK